jgi:hypothetical protein
MSDEPRAAHHACVRRPVADFARATRLVEDLRKALDGAAGRPLRYHVYGGFVRACITGESFSDVDVAAATEEDLRVLRVLRQRPLHVRDARGDLVAVRLDVCRRPVASPAALVTGVELVMARLAYSTTDDSFHMDAECLEALATRILTLRPVGSRLATPARTITRTFKYAARGARLPLATLLSSVAEYRATPAVKRWGERALRAILQPNALATGERRSYRAPRHADRRAVEMTPTAVAHLLHREAGRRDTSR